MEKYKAQITPPEQPAQRAQTIEVDSKTASEQVKTECAEIIAAKVGNLLHGKLRLIDRRLNELAFVDQDTYIHNIEGLKAELRRLYQQLKFAAYDYEYGLEECEDHFRAAVDLPGDNANLLTKFGAITWVLEQADQALIHSHKDIEDLEKVIEESQSRLADLEQVNNHEKEKRTLNQTIQNREKRLKPKKRRHRELVRAINAILNIDAKDVEALLQGTDDLLAFLLSNKLVDKKLSKNFSTTSEGIKEKFQIRKIFEEIAEATTEAAKDTGLSQEERAERNRRRRRRRKQGNKSQQAEEDHEDVGNLDWAEELTAPQAKTFLEHHFGTPKEMFYYALVLLGLSFSVYQFTKSDQGPMKAKGPHPLHETEKVVSEFNGKKRILKLICTSPEIGLDDDSLKLVIFENARRQAEFILTAPFLIEDKDIEIANTSAKAKPSIVIDSKGAPISYYLSFAEFVQGIDGYEFVKTTGENDPQGPFNVYKTTMVRRAKVVITFIGENKSTYEMQVDGKVSFLTKRRKAEEPGEN